MTILEKKVFHPLAQRRERVFVGGRVDRLMPVSLYAGGMTAISRWLSESDSTGIDLVDNFRILKGFQTHPSFWCRVDNVVARQECDPAGVDWIRYFRYRWRR